MLLKKEKQTQTTHSDLNETLNGNAHFNTPRKTGMCLH